MGKEEQEPAMMHNRISSLKKQIDTTNTTHQETLQKKLDRQEALESQFADLNYPNLVGQVSCLQDQMAKLQQQHLQNARVEERDSNVLKEILQRVQESAGLREEKKRLERRVADQQSHLSQFDAIIKKMSDINDHNNQTWNGSVVAWVLHMLAGINTQMIRLHEQTDKLRSELQASCVRAATLQGRASRLEEEKSALEQKNKDLQQRLDDALAGNTAASEKHLLKLEHRVEMLELRLEAAEELARERIALVRNSENWQHLRVKENAPS